MTRLQPLRCALKPTRSISPPGTYFVTLSTARRQRLFVVERYAYLFLITMYGYRRQHKFRLHAFVLMPEHVHLLITPDVTSENAVQLIKGGYSHAFGVEFGSTRMFGNEASPTIAFATQRILNSIAYTFIRIRLNDDSFGPPKNSNTLRHSPDLA